MASHRRDLPHAGSLRNIQHFGLFCLGLVCLTLGVTGCTGSPADDAEWQSVTSQGCQAPDDQRGSFMARLSHLPVRVSVDPEFEPAQVSAIRQAVAEWNVASQVLIQQDLFVLDTRSPFSSALKSASLNACDLPAENDRTVVTIVRERDLGHWRRLGFDRDKPGVTLRCTRGTRLERQSVFVYTEVVEKEQLASVILHELGHAAGLDHSCSGEAGRDDFRACAGLPHDHPYVEAVMFPWLRTRVGDLGPELKETLRSNDKIRARCIMGN